MNERALLARIERLEEYCRVCHEGDMRRNAERRLNSDDFDAIMGRVKEFWESDAGTVHLHGSRGWGRE